MMGIIFTSGYFHGIVIAVLHLCSCQMHMQSFAFDDTNAYAISYETDPRSWYFYFPGLIYKRLLINGKHTRKSDVINMLGTSRLSLDDVRFEYNANYAPVAA